MHLLSARPICVLFLAVAQAQLLVDYGDNDISKKFIQFPVSRSATTLLDRRHVTTSLSNQIRTYMIDIAIGSSQQKVTLALDTGSSDIWVNSSPCEKCEGGTFNESASSSDIELDNLGEFELAYIDGTSVSGRYHSDDIVIGNATVQNTTFAVVNNTAGSGYGIMGIGVPASQPLGSQYSSFLDDMKAQGLINSRAYSLQLNSETVTTGSIVFGGYDSTNYSPMTTTSMISSAEASSRLAIEWNGITLKDSNGTTKYAQTNESRPVMLDTGFTLSTLPDDIFSIISEDFEVKKSGDNYYVPCQQPEGHVEMHFEGNSSTDQIVISVPFSELAIPADLEFGEDEGQDLCMFGFQPVSAWSSSDGFMSFGDTFLRSAYLMVNLDTNTVGLMQASGNYCEECIAEI